MQVLEFWQKLGIEYYASYHILYSIGGRAGKFQENNVEPPHPVQY